MFTSVDEQDVFLNIYLINFKNVLELKVLL